MIKFIPRFDKQSLFLSRIVLILPWSRSHRALPVHSATSVQVNMYFTTIWESRLHRQRRNTLCRFFSQADDPPKNAFHPSRTYPESYQMLTPQFSQIASRLHRRKTSLLKYNAVTPRLCCHFTFPRKRTAMYSTLVYGRYWARLSLPPCFHEK